MTVWKGQHLTDLYQCLETVQTFDVPLRLMTPSLSIIGTHTCRMTLLQYEAQQPSNYRNVRVFSFPPTMNTLSPPGDQSSFKWGWFSFRKEWASVGDSHCCGATRNMLQARFPGRPSILLSKHQPVHFLHTQRCPWEASLLMCMYNTDALCTCCTPSTFIHDCLSRHAK